MSEISSKIVRMEIDLYRNPRGTNNFFYSDKLPTYFNSPNQLNMILDGIKQNKRIYEKRNSIKSLHTVPNPLNKANLKIINVGGDGCTNESGFRLKWFDLDQCADVTDQYKVYDQQVITILGRLCNQPVDEKDNSSIYYGYNDECMYCRIKDYESVNWQECEDFEKSFDENTENSLTTPLPTQTLRKEKPTSISTQPNALDPQFIPYKSQTLTVPDEEGYCTCAPSISIIHCFSLKF